MSFSYEYERCQSKNFILAKRQKSQYSELRIQYSLFVLNQYRNLPFCETELVPPWSKEKDGFVIWRKEKAQQEET